jgi:cobalt-zinc-cadmium efflux system membrane fusion protein
MSLPSFRPVAVGAGAVLLAGVVVVIVLSLDRAAGAETAAPSDEGPAAPHPREAPVRLTKAERAALHIATSPAHYQVQPQELRMSATTALDPDALAHVHPRFAGEATEVKARLGRHVKRGQVLAVVWSKDLGEKKSEYIDNRSQYRLNKTVFDRIKESYDKGAIPERSYLQAMRDLEQARIAFDRARRTLLSWKLTEAEINQIEHESDTVWPRDTVKSPIDGVIVERNVVPGELVDPSMNLFVVADLSRLAVWAYASEDDVLKLHAGDRWTVHLKALAGKEFKGTIGVVGSIIDPTQHTATVQGLIDNPGDRLAAGMFATATVLQLPQAGEVVVPTTALIDDGDQTGVYVQSAKDPGEFRWVPVHVLRRGRTESALDRGPLPDERVVVRGALELHEKAEGQNE